LGGGLDDLDDVFIGSRTWHRSFTRCSFSRSLQDVSIFPRSRRTARLGGMSVPVHSLLSQAGETIT
jgi:hypothetical protein